MGPDVGGTAAGPRLVLLTTTVAGTPGHGHLARLAQHLTDEHDRCHLPVTWYVLVQGGTADATLPPFTRVSAHPEVGSLSAARNRLLGLAAGELADAVVAFPDDDAWHPAGLLPAVLAAFTADPELDLLFCRYSSRPEQVTDLGGVAASVGQVVRHASSNTVFVRGGVAAAVGAFDERLGVGTPLGGAEDLDHALRCLPLARGRRWVDAALVGHRDKNPEVRAKYFLASALVLRRHRRQPGVRAQYLRKLAVGAVLVVRRELDPATLRRAVTGAEPA